MGNLTGQVIRGSSHRAAGGQQPVIIKSALSMCLDCCGCVCMSHGCGVPCVLQIWHEQLAAALSTTTTETKDDKSSERVHHVQRHVWHTGAPAFQKRSCERGILVLETVVANCYCHPFEQGPPSCPMPARCSLASAGRHSSSSPLSPPDAIMSPVHSDDATSVMIQQHRPQERSNTPSVLLPRLHA